MNLHGSVTELQNKTVQLYLKLEQRFSENTLVRELWSAMAHDISQQIDSLKALPPSFWQQVVKDQNGSFEASLKSAQPQAVEKTDDISLPASFELVLCFEEPAILKVYVPIIKSLRKNLTVPALDFYIMVKSHLARIVRVTGSFSGNPLAIQRSLLLMQSFEKEIQEPPVVYNFPERKKVRAGLPLVEKKPVMEKKPAIARKSVVEKKPAAKSKSTPKPAHPLSKHVKIHHSRTKPLVKKVNIPRRRARR